MDDLEKLYSPSCWTNRPLSSQECCEYHIKFITEVSDLVRTDIQCQLNIPYGPLKREKLDIFGTDLDDDVPILVFVHGGYWQIKELGRQSYHFIADNFYKKKIKTIFVGYELCPDVTLYQITKQIERAVGKCLNYAKQLQSRGLYFMGHSAGAHLLAHLFSNFIPSLPATDGCLIKGIFLISGVFNLEPLHNTSVNVDLKMNQVELTKLSPLRNDFFSGSTTAFNLFLGNYESPAFLEQSKIFGEKLKSLGVKASFDVIPNVDHFNIIELLSNEDFELTQRIEQIINANDELRS